MAVLGKVYFCIVFMLSQNKETKMPHIGSPIVNMANENLSTESVVRQ